MNENKFTPTAEEALRLAQEAAGELGHGYVVRSTCCWASCVRTRDWRIPY